MPSDRHGSLALLSTEPIRPFLRPQTKVELELRWLLQIVPMHQRDRDPPRWRQIYRDRQVDIQARVRRRLLATLPWPLDRKRARRR
jgi:hypothetical protein